MSYVIRQIYIVSLIVIVTGCSVNAQTLEVKPNRTAVVKESPSGSAEQFPDRLPAGTRVGKVGEVPYYFQIRLADGRIGWSYKGYFDVVSADGELPGSPSVDASTLQARTDVLKIVILDVEVGDATLLICPKEDGEQDVILIDTGENDGDRIRAELARQGFPLCDKPIDRMFITHYDYDHVGDAADVLPLVKVVYDHGDNNVKTYYRDLVTDGTVDRRTASLSYQETFSGGVEIECVAVNCKTAATPQALPSAKENDNSIALLISYGDFDYFTGGDLTSVPEKALAQGIRNCDVYHVDHHGSKATSSDLEFVTKLDPEVSIASNGDRHGHPNAVVAKRLIDQVGSDFYQTNVNPDERAYHPDEKFVADDTYHEDDDDEDLEGALGNIMIVVDMNADKYYVVMPGLPLAEGTYEIEH